MHKFVQVLLPAIFTSLVVSLVAILCNQPKAESRIVTLTCLNITGTSIVTYTGTTDDIRWHSDGTYVSVRLLGKNMNIPQFRCEYSES